MKHLRQLLTLIFFAAVPFHSMAWGMLGHRITAEIADAYLSSKARKKIKAILGNESLAMASTWGDFIKSDPSFSFLNSWHYVNLPENLNYDQMLSTLRADTTPNAWNKLHFLINEVKKRQLTQTEKQLYLRLIIHIVGDLHQPMHVSRAEDQGGNRIYVQWFGQRSNLHRVWDNQLIAFQELSYTEYAKAINFISREQRRTLGDQPIEAWVYESYQISARLYSEITEPNINLSFRYNFDHVDLLNQQLLKGGVRLAALLNNIFG